MERPRNVSGWCPNFDEPSECCYLTDSSPSNTHIDQHCKSDYNCKRCGNYEAWVNGRNYTEKTYTNNYK